MQSDQCGSTAPWTQFLVMCFSPGCSVWKFCSICAQRFPQRENCSGGGCITVLAICKLADTLHLFPNHGTKEGNRQPGLKQLRLSLQSPELSPSGHWGMLCEDPWGARTRPPTVCATSHRPVTGSQGWWLLVRADGCLVYVEQIFLE